MVVGGRKVRTEVAEARRKYNCAGLDTLSSFYPGSVILYKIDGTTLSYQEVHYVLGSYGHIEEVKPTTHADATQFGVPIGFWVKFSFYLDYKDLLSVSGIHLTTPTILTTDLALQPLQRDVFHHGCTRRQYTATWSDCPCCWL